MRTKSFFLTIITCLLWGSCSIYGSYMGMSSFPFQINYNVAVISGSNERTDSLLATSTSRNAKLLYNKGIFLRNKGRLTEALDVLGKAYNSGILLDEQEKLETLYSIALVQNDLGKPVDALRTVTRLISLPKSDSLKYFNIKGLMTVYNVNISLCNFHGALKAVTSGRNQLENLKSVIKESEYNSISSTLFIMIGQIHAWNHNFPEAFESFKRAGEFANEEQQGILNLSIGLLYSLMREYDISIEYYQKAIHDRKISAKNRANAILNYTVALVDEKKYEEALETVDKHKLELEPIYGTPEEFKLWNVISEAYEGKEEWKLALEYRTKSFFIRDSLLSGDIRGQIGNALTEIDDITRRNSNHSSDVIHSKFVTAIWILAVLLFFGLIATVSLFIINRRNKNRVIQLGDRLDKSKNEVARMSIAEEEKKQLSQELSVTKARLSHISESLDELRKLAANPKTYKSEIVSAVEKTTRSVSADSQVWEPFMAYAEGASPAFFDKLYTLHPDLSNSETRMCAFILLGRTTKEIAAILNRSPRTVESIKYNLRVKLRVKDMTTEQYLRKISATPLEELLTTST